MISVTKNEGQYWEGLFEKGLFNGLIRQYIKDGLRKYYLFNEVTYKNGYGIGEQTSYDENGNSTNNYKYPDILETPHMNEAIMDERD